MLRDRIVDLLEPALQTPGAVCVDGTLGMGGHAEAILERCPQARVIGLDRDEEALTLSGERLARFGDRFVGVHAVYDDIATVLAERAEGTALGILFDLGVSSLQLDEADRGFAYRHDAPLDMRMDQSTGITAADVLNTYRHGDLARILKTYGEERFAGRIAVGHRARAREGAVHQLGPARRAAARLRCPAASQRTGGHPAKRTFQALRIEVNAELEVWQRAVTSAIEVLAPGGRIAVLSYHSLEDRITKQAFAAGAHSRTPHGMPVELPEHAAYLRLLTRGAEVPDEQEQHTNPRSASARLRAAERLIPERSHRMSQLAPVRPLPRTSPRRAAPTPRQLKVVAPPQVQGNGLFLALCVVAAARRLRRGAHAEHRDGQGLVHDARPPAPLRPARRHPGRTAAHHRRRSPAPAPSRERARALGMVPAASPAFLRLSDGKVLGVAKKAKDDSTFSVVTEPKAPTRSTPVATIPAPAGTPACRARRRRPRSRPRRPQPKPDDARPQGTTAADPAPRQLTDRRPHHRHDTDGESRDPAQDATALGARATGVGAGAHPQGHAAARRVDAQADRRPRPRLVSHGAPAAPRAPAPPAAPRRGPRPPGTTPATARSTTGQPRHRRPARADPLDPPTPRRSPRRGRLGRRRTVALGGSPAGNPRRRMRFLTVACLFVLSIFGAQLVRIQGFDATAVAQEAQLKREAAQIIPAMRGQVLASDGTVLASSVVREVVVADQTAVCTYGTGKNTCDPRPRRTPCSGPRPSSRRCSTPPSPSWSPSSPAPAATASSAARSRRSPGTPSPPWGSRASTATGARPGPSAPTPRAARRPPSSAT